MKGDRSSPYDRRRLRRRLLAVCATLASSAAAQAQQPDPSTLANTARAEEIVVTARRSGIPVWHVVGPRSTVILVGTIRKVASGTQWDPAPLETALLRADRIMFPETTTFALNLGGALSAWRKWKRQAVLPKGQTLRSMMSPTDFSRLNALARAGLVKPGFETRHPYHLARALGTGASGRLAPAADAYVRRVAKKKELAMVPLARGNSKSVISDFFASDPATHIPCLIDAIALAEAGPGAIKARSDAWADRKVAIAVRSVAGRMEQSCFPEGSRFERARQNGLHGVIRELLTEPRITVAVLTLDSLAVPDGVLDRLSAEGHDVRGPAWRPESK